MFEHRKLIRTLHWLGLTGCLLMSFVTASWAAPKPQVIFVDSSPRLVLSWQGIDPDGNVSLVQKPASDEANGNVYKLWGLQPIDIAGLDRFMAGRDLHCIEVYRSGNDIAVDCAISLLSKQIDPDGNLYAESIFLYTPKRRTGVYLFEVLPKLKLAENSCSVTDGKYVISVKDPNVVFRCDRESKSRRGDKTTD